MSKQEFPPLAVGTYIPTPEFVSIAAHAAVMFERDCGLVATTGRAQDPEAQRYARLFAAAPTMLAALELALRRWDRCDIPLDEAFRAVQQAIRAARGEATPCE